MPSYIKSIEILAPVIVSSRVEITQLKTDRNVYLLGDENVKTPLLGKNISFLQISYSEVVKIWATDLREKILKTCQSDSVSKD